MSDKNIGTELSRRRILRGTGAAGIAGVVGVSGITSGRANPDDSTGNSITVTTEFDSGGGVEIDREGNHVELTKIDEGGYSFLGYMHFKLEEAEGEDVSFEITNLDDSRMLADYRLVYASDPENGGWTRMDEEVGDGFSHTPESDEVYISGYRAYPYRRTVDRVAEVEAAYPTFVETEVIGRSTDGRDMHAIRITDPAVDDAGKKDVISLTRQHPGEVEGSWHMDAAIDYVLETFCRRNLEFAEDLRFHFIPNANPDGIYEGYHRHSPPGYDLNRQWDAESPVEIENVKGYMRRNLDDVHWGFDFHSSTNGGHDAVIYDERAASEEDIDVIEDIATHSLSYPDRTRAIDSDRLACGFVHDEFDATMVVTEAWTYREYSAAELATEGRNFFREAIPRAE